MNHSPPPQHVLTWPEHGVEMAFRLIPAGRFRMGSRGVNVDEEPEHEVVVTQDFWLAETPVTQSQFAIWTKAEGIDHKNHFDGHPDHPAENMDWHQAVDYCRWLTRDKLPQFPDGFSTACLPSEAQWEYACRAGTETEYYTGDGEESLVEAGWHGEEWESGSTHPIAQKQPNEFMLYDMHGNVFEWCRDRWDEHAYRGRPDGVRDPESTGDSLVDESQLRVLRGGSWYFTAYRCRSAFRFWFVADNRFRNTGFRVCLVRSPAGKQKRSGGGAGARET